MHFCNPEKLLPAPVRSFIETLPEYIPDPEKRMLTVIELSRLNIMHRSGGPFGAAVFEHCSGRLIAAGVNVVIESRCSHAHAEMIALAAAEQRLRTHDLGLCRPELELVTSTEPCAMCFGAIIWSGIRHVLCGATCSDAEQTGFDEGPKPADWRSCLERRGISVTTEQCRAEAGSVLLAYSRSGGPVYNPDRSR
jgi:tRNA(Arg) A34 adenosine deaminase TadA